MNYNDGKWHGWNGGECPVHPETVVDYVWFDSAFEDELCGVAKHRKASNNVAWSQVVKFRVIKEHKSPREWWILHGKIYGYDCDPSSVHVREVIE